MEIDRATQLNRELFLAHVFPTLYTISQLSETKSCEMPLRTWQRTITKPLRAYADNPESIKRFHEPTGTLAGYMERNAAVTIGNVIVTTWVQAQDIIYKAVAFWIFRQWHTPTIEDHCTKCHQLRWTELRAYGKRTPLGLNLASDYEIEPYLGSMCSTDCDGHELQMREVQRAVETHNFQRDRWYRKYTSEESPCPSVTARLQESYFVEVRQTGDLTLGWRYPTVPEIRHYAGTMYQKG
jgi:hypothetical protein